MLGETVDLLTIFNKKIAMGFLKSNKCSMLVSYDLGLSIGSYINLFLARYRMLLVKNRCFSKCTSKFLHCPVRIALELRNCRALLQREKEATFFKHASKLFTFNTCQSMKCRRIAIER